MQPALPAGRQALHEQEATLVAEDRVGDDLLPVRGSARRAPARRRSRGRGRCPRTHAVAPSPRRGRNPCGKHSGKTPSVERRRQFHGPEASLRGRSQGVPTPCRAFGPENERAILLELPQLSRCCERSALSTPDVVPRAEPGTQSWFQELRVPCPGSEQCDARVATKSSEGSGRERSCKPVLSPSEEGRVAISLGALLPHRFTLAARKTSRGIGGLFSVALSLASRPVAVSNHPDSAAGWAGRPMHGSRTTWPTSSRRS